MVAAIPRSSVQLRTFTGLQANATFDKFVNPTTLGQAGTVYYNGTGVGGVAPYTCSWDWGDGHQSGGCIAANHQWGNGTFQIALTVTDHVGTRAVATFHVVNYVKAGGGIAHIRPMLSTVIGWGFLGPCGNPHVWCTPILCPCANFIQTDSQAFSGTGPYSYAVQFPGNLVLGQFASDTLSGPGTFSFGLQATDHNGVFGSHTINGVSTPLYP